MKTPKSTTKVLFGIFTLALMSCGGNINTIGSKYFTEDGEPLEKISIFSSKQPNDVKFYIEVSGSMNGFFRSNQSTTFKRDVWSVITDFTPSNGAVNVFTQQNKQAAQIPVNVFKEGMNKGAFVSSSSTDVPDMFDRMLDDINPKANGVGVLISDMKYDPVGNSALKALLTEYSTDIRNIMMKHPGFSVCLIAAKSEYLDKNCKEVTDNSPYYYLIAGNKQNVVYMRNFISTLLNDNKTYVDEIEWGIDYMSPSITISDADYLTEIDENRSYGDFDEECDITMSIDITNYPWIFENKDTLASCLKITTQEGTEAKIDAKRISYDVSYDDGKQLKRTAIAKVPVVIKNMYEDSDVLEIKLVSPEIQMPNKGFIGYLGSEDVNDVNTTFSMEGLLAGFYGSMERYKDSKPIHILISKK